MHQNNTEQDSRSMNRVILDQSEIKGIAIWMFERE